AMQSIKPWTPWDLCLEFIARGSPAREVRRRLERLLAKLQEGLPPGGSLRELRAVEALEHIATPEAQQLLQKLAGSAAAARSTREAKASLERLARRDPRYPKSPSLFAELSWGPADQNQRASHHPFPSSVRAPSPGCRRGEASTATPALPLLV